MSSSGPPRLRYPRNLHNLEFDPDRDWINWNPPNHWVPSENMCSPELWDELSGYQRFLIFVREMLGRGQVVIVHNPEDLENSTHFRILPNKEGGVDRTFDLVLTAERKSISIRLRWENIYLVGYRNRTGDWICFEGDEKYFNGDNPNSLGYNSSYSSIRGQTKRVNNSISYGYHALRNAIITLWKTKIKEKEEDLRAQAFEVIICMICEATRFSYLGKFIDLETMENVAMETSSYDYFVNSWSNLSQQLLNASKDPNFVFRGLPVSDDDNLPKVRTIKEAKKVIGILLP